MQVGSPHFTTRMHQAIEKSILDKVQNNAFVRRLNGEVTAVDTATMTASVKILGNTSASTGFKIRSAIVPVVGNLVSVCIDGQERWVDSILAGSTQKKLIVGSDGLLQWGPGGAAYDTNLYRTGSGQLKTDGEFHSNRLRLLSTVDVDNASTNHAFQIGLSSAANLAIDDNEIQARSNGSSSDLYLNASGGVVRVGSGGLDVSGTTTLGSTVYTQQGSSTTFAINNGGTATFSSKNCEWVQIGRIVTFHLGFTVTANGSGSSTVTITSTGLPVPARQSYMPGGRAGTGVNVISGRLTGSSTFDHIKVDNTDAIITGADLANTATYSLMGAYLV